MIYKSPWIILCAIFVSCSPNFPKEDIEYDQVVLSHERSELNKRVTHFNLPLSINDDGIANVDLAQIDKETLFDESSGSLYTDLDHTWYFVAQVAPPSLNDETLSATHVQVIDDRSYVSYNKQGSLHLGGLEVYDLSNKAYPYIISQILFNDADVNALTVDYKGNKNYRRIWLALSHRKYGAVLRQVELIDGLLSDNIIDIKLSDYIDSGISASANSVVRSGNSLFVTAGKSHGGLYIFDANSLEFLGVDEYQNAKYVAANGRNPSSSIASLITGDSAAIYITSPGSNDGPEELAIGQVLHQNVQGTYRGKSVIHFTDSYEDVAFVAMGRDGLKGFDITTFEERFHTKNNLLTTGNTNGVSSDDDFIYMANGADGLAVAIMPEQDGVIAPIFTWDLNERAASANYLTTDGEWIFVAKGGKGLKILRKTDEGEHQTIHGIGPYGVPLGLEPNDVEVCTELLPNLYTNVLPENSNVLERSPEFFENTNREIELLKTDKVYVTFITEAAGYKNTLGYYYYHKDNPPSSTDDLNKVVIFPNASKENHGGRLIEGNTMKLLGTFEEGTMIGFYLITNGWNGRKITNGIYTQYTIPRFNLSRAQQSIMYHDQRCSNLVMTFEDIALPRGDKDFNDVIFMISSADSTSLDTSVFIQQ